MEAAPGIAKWYEQAQFRCDDPYGIRQTVERWLAQIPFTFTSVSQDRGYARVTAENYYRLAQPGDVVWQSVLVDQSIATSLKTRLASEPQGVVVGITRVLGDWLADFLQGMGTIITSIMEYFVSSGGHKGITGEALQLWIAEGGVLQRTYDARLQNSKRPYLAERINYRVRLGTEERTIVLAVCLYPVYLDIRQIETSSPLNNKRLVLQGTTWRRQDVDTGNEEAAYREYDRDELFIYFERIDEPDDGDRERISQLGGPWQTLTANGQWKTLYSKTRAY